MSRADLDALDDEALAVLANLGLVRRARREQEAGALPELEETPAGAVTARFPDGTVAEVPAGAGLGRGRCTCGAVGVCRHLVGLVLARRSAPGPPAGEPAPWDPGALVDADLRRAAGPAAWTRASRAREAGVVVEIEPGPVPMARLPAATVRFLVPSRPDYARCDCAGAAPCEHAVLAVWAFRQAEGQAGTVALGRESSRDAPDRSLLEVIARLVDAILLDGLANLGEQRLEVAARRLGARGYTWAGDVVSDLRAQRDAYVRRSARHDDATVAGLLIELAARLRAAGSAPAGAWRQALGADEPAESVMDQARLVSLGARVADDGAGRLVELFLADPRAGSVLVLERRFAAEPATGAALAAREVAAGVAVGALAAGQLVSRRVRRLANRRIALGTARGVTSVLPAAGEWDRLPEPVLVPDLARFIRAPLERPPRLLRPRVAATGVHVLPVLSVDGAGYDPGQQLLFARVAVPGGVALAVRRHRAAAGSALEALAAALAGGSGRVRFLSGTVRRRPWGVEIEPLGVLADRLVVPDLAAPGAPLEAEIGRAGQPDDPLLGAVEALRSCLREGCHQGLRGLAPGWAASAVAAAERLGELGLRELSERLRALLDAVRAGRSGAGWDAAAPAWRSAAILAELTLEGLCAGS